MIRCYLRSARPSAPCHPPRPLGKPSACSAAGSRGSWPTTSPTSSAARSPGTTTSPTSTTPRFRTSKPNETKPLLGLRSTSRIWDMTEWRLSALGDIADSSSGATPPRGVARYWSDGGHPWATIADLCSDPVVVTSETVSDAGSPFAGRVVENGAILMSFKLTVGRVARAGVDLQTNEAIVWVRGRPGIVDEGCLYHTLPRIAASGVTDKAVKGATLNQAKLRALHVDLPPLEEQRRIAELLDVIDETIQATERVIAKQGEFALASRRICSAGRRVPRIRRRARRHCQLLQPALHVAWSGVRSFSETVGAGSAGELPTPALLAIGEARFPASRLAL